MVIIRLQWNFTDVCAKDFKMLGYVFIWIQATLTKIGPEQATQRRANEKKKPISCSHVKKWSLIISPGTISLNGYEAHPPSFKWSCTVPASPDLPPGNRVGLQILCKSADIVNFEQGRKVAWRKKLGRPQTDWNRRWCILRTSEP